MPAFLNSYGTCTPNSPQSHRATPFQHNRDSLVSLFRAGFQSQHPMTNRNLASAAASSVSEVLTRQQQHLSEIVEDIMRILDDEEDDILEEGAW